jgi:hypothetical protein
VIDAAGAPMIRSRRDIMTTLVAISLGSSGAFMPPRTLQKVFPHFARYRAEYDGDKPWSENDLFDLESALAFAGNVEEIAIFLSREVQEVRRKASERGWSI